MQIKVTALSLVLLTLLAQPHVALAQAAPAPHEWSILKSVPPGDELVVRLKNNRTVAGRLRVVSDIHLTLARDGRTIDIDRQDVQRIQRIVPKSAAKPTLIGAGTGAGIALAGLGVAAAADDTGGSDGELAAAALGFALIGAGVGALVGLAFGSRQKKVLIYESR